MNVLRGALPILVLLFATSPARANETPESTAMEQHAHPVYELRQYTLHPGQRDTGHHQRGDRPEHVTAVLQQPVLRRARHRHRLALGDHLGCGDRLALRFRG